MDLTDLLTHSGAAVAVCKLGQIRAEVKVGIYVCNAVEKDCTEATVFQVSRVDICIADICDCIVEEALIPEAVVVVCDICVDFLRSV